MFIQNAYAAGEAATTAPGFNWILIVAMVAIFYFMIIRPQSKRNKALRTMMDNLAKGDEVLTNGGIIGKIIKLSDDGHFLIVEIAKDIQIKCQKNAVASLLPKGTVDSIKA